MAGSRVFVCTGTITGRDVERAFHEALDKFDVPLWGVPDEVEVWDWVAYRLAGQDDWDC